MRLVSYDRRGQRRLGALVEGGVVDLPDAVGHPVFPQTMEALVARRRGSLLGAAREALQRDDVEEFSVPDARLLLPIVPASLLDVRAPAPRTHGSVALDGAIGQHWVIGPEDDVPWPLGATELRFEPGIACVMGAGGANLRPRDAEAAVFGYVLMVNWRVVVSGPRQRGSGSASDFATSVGPVVVTADEMDPHSLSLNVTLDGQPYGRVGGVGAKVALRDALARISRRQQLWPGDVCSFGGRRSALAAAAVQPGSFVEVDGGPLGVLATTVARPE